MCDATLEQVRVFTGSLLLFSFVVPKVLEHPKSPNFTFRGSSFQLALSKFTRSLSKFCDRVLRPTGAPQSGQPNYKEYPQKGNACVIDSRDYLSLPGEFY